jgi:prolyl-tRNA synthetase
MIMVHGDDHGLRVPPRLAPTQAIVLAARAGEGVIEGATTLVDELRGLGVRVELDDRLEISVGRRIVDHELRGVPLRIELGPRELATGEAVVAHRVSSSKETVALEGLAPRVPQMLADDQQELLRQATALRDGRTQRASTLQEAEEIARDGFARIPWRTCGSGGEDRLAQAGISVRCLLRADQQPEDDPDDDAVEALLARAY